MYVNALLLLAITDRDSDSKSLGRAMAQEADDAATPVEGRSHLSPRRNTGPKGPKEYDYSIDPNNCSGTRWPT